MKKMLVLATVAMIGMGFSSGAEASFKGMVEAGAKMVGNVLKHHPEYVSAAMGALQDPVVGAVQSHFGSSAAGTVGTAFGMIEAAIG